MEKDNHKVRKRIIAPIKHACKFMSPLLKNCVKHCNSEAKNIAEGTMRWQNLNLLSLNQMKHNKRMVAQQSNRSLI